MDLYPTQDQSRFTPASENLPVADEPVMAIILTDACDSGIQRLHRFAPTSDRISSTLARA
jgi:UTP-glucose-1-phosphate uridylyltransferase